MTAFLHKPVMLDEAIELLNPARGGIFVDGTLGGGGHSEGILKLLPPGSKLIGIDRDSDALTAASERLKNTAKNLRRSMETFLTPSIYWVSLIYAR